MTIQIRVENKISFVFDLDGIISNIIEKIPNILYKPNILMSELFGSLFLTFSVMVIVYQRFISMLDF